MLNTSNLRFLAEIELRRRLHEGVEDQVPSDVTEWLRMMFPKFFSKVFADRHLDFWNWVESIGESRPQPFVGLWGRGSAKSTSAEAAPVRLGSRRVRNYAWYVSGTQDKADSHVLNISALLESRQVEVHYPGLAQRAVGKFGNPKGWRRSRVSTALGLTVDALGLDTGSRGVKFEEQRPDLIILDDIDDLHDTQATTEKKIETLTQSVLPAGSTNCAVLFIQNLIHEDSIASRLFDGRADFLIDRIISGPYPAIEDFSYELKDHVYTITGGTPTWEGQNLKICQEQINTWGLTAFRREAQHEVELSGNLWEYIEFRHIELKDLPDLLRTVIWVDPAVSTTDDSDSMGVSAGGVDEHQNLYFLKGREKITTPEEALEYAIELAYEYGCSYIGIETDQGGDTWKSVYMRALAKVKQRRALRYPNGDVMKAPDYRFDKAGAGYGSKSERNLQLLTYYEQGRVFHVQGEHLVLEKALRRFPKKPLDLADSWWWCYRDLVDQPGWLLWAKERKNAQEKNQHRTPS